MAGLLACLASCLLLLGGLAANPAVAVTRAGTPIVNRAQVQGQLDGEPQQSGSNEVTDRVDEELDVSLTAESGSPVRLERQTESQPVALLLRNLGNGSEAFKISAELSGGGARLRSFALDSNDDGRFDPTTDTVFAPNDTTPPLEPGATLRMFALFDVADAGEANIGINAQSITGFGEPGTRFAGKGDGGSDAEIGATHAEASVRIDLAVTGPAVSLVKSQQILATNGSDLPVRGATIRYVIEARLAPGATVSDARIVDPVPEGTTYVPGSLTLNGGTLSDVADNDPGLFRDNAIEVALRDIATAPIQLIAFDVRIN